MSDGEGAVPTKTQQLKGFADNVTANSIKRLSLSGQLKQALIALERYLDEDEQILSEAEMMIPKFALSKAKGVVFLSLIKCGFLFAGCIGTGCVVVKTGNGSWSGPSSIACAGLSVGLLAGASKIDYIMILPNKMAVKSFMSSGQLRIGGDLSITVGNIGRTAYSNVGKGNVGGISVVYSYSHSKGLYGGISLHGKILTVRNECNKQFYGFEAHNEAILCGDIQMPYDYTQDHYQQIVHILNSYCYDQTDNMDDRKDVQYPLEINVKQSEHKHDATKGIEQCSCKLCRASWKKLDKTNPFHQENVKQKKTNRFVKDDARKSRNMTVNKVERSRKISQKISKTKISTETFLLSEDDMYRYIDPKLEIVGDKVKLKLDDPWRKNIEKDNDEKIIENEVINQDPYALNIRPWDKLIEPIYPQKEEDNKFKDVMDEAKQQAKDEETFCIDVEDDEEGDIKEKKTETQKAHTKYVKPKYDKHYSDHNIEKYSLSNYDDNGYRINTFSLLFQIDDISYETNIEIAGKLVSKQYVVNWPKKRDCKAVIIVTSQTYSSYMTNDTNDIKYELRLICYDERDDDLIVYQIYIKFCNIKQLVNAMNGVFIISPSKPWVVLESIFNQYDKKMHESMIDVSTNYDEENVLRYGDLIRANFGSLCQYGIYVGDREVVCFRRRFPNNASSAFKKYRLFLMVFSGKASKQITMKYMTLDEFIADCSRIEVIYYPIPSISSMEMARKALIATNGGIKNCLFEYSQIIESKRTLTPKEIIEDSVLSVLNTITEAVSPPV